MKYLTKITGTIPYTTKEVDINVDGKHLIITGGNGSGKTSFIKDLYKRIMSFAHQKIYKNPINIDFELFSGFSQKLYESQIVILHYEADRRFDNNANKNELTGNIDITPKQFEEYLIKLRTKQTFAFEEQEEKYYLELKGWFENFGRDLKYLFEDDSLKLNFNSRELNFYISQNNKFNYTFSSLSRGYSAIFVIFAELLYKVNEFNISPKNLEGIVLIDEIDAHLHVSLQRKILPFLTSSFPNLQFVVTTHSPFIITSLSDAVVYDLSTLEHFEDVSMYSYETVVEGILGVPPMAIQLHKDITELSELIENPQLNQQEVQQIIDKIDLHSENLSNLDDEAKLIYYRAKNSISLLKNNK